MQTNDALYDVIIVGYGPTGLVLASLLGQLGHRVAVVERWPQLYGLPRLTHIDGETARLVSLVCDGDHALRESWTTPHYNWVNGKGTLLLDVGAGNTRKMIWDDHISVHQPHIEEAIDERVRAMQNVTFFRGHVAADLQQKGGIVELKIQPWTKGQAADAAGVGSVLRGRYLVGADGSKSFVRNALGVAVTDFGFNERWLCVDTVPKRPLPPSFDANAVQVCDPKRGHMFMPIGKKRQRFEFALLRSETKEEMEQPEAAWRLLKQYHGLGPDDLTFMRRLIYTFECRLAQKWRVGNVFLAGDAAHTNPPYLGQGACSGMRDASNLAWKFDLVLRGLAKDALLDSYEPEREPHAKTLMLGSRSLGMVANTSNPIKAAVRDLLFRFKLTPPPPVFPTLTDGVLQRKDDGSLAPQAGGLPGQGHLVMGGERRRFDQHSGYAFTLLLRRDPGSAISSRRRADLEAMNANVFVLEATASGAGFQQVFDADGVYRKLLDELGADAVLLRPDFVLYGHASMAAVDDLLQGLTQQLQCTSASAPAPQAA